MTFGDWIRTLPVGTIIYGGFDVSMKKYIKVVRKVDHELEPVDMMAGDLMYARLVNRWKTSGPPYGETYHVVSFDPPNICRLGEI